MKRIFGCCLCLAAAASALAQGVFQPGTVSLTIASPLARVFADRGYPTAPWTYADGAPIAQGERFRLVAVRATAKTAADFDAERALVLDGTARVVIDASGAPVPVGFPETCLGANGQAVERQVVEGRAQTDGNPTTQRVGPVPGGALATGTSSCTLSASGGHAQESVSVPSSTWNLTTPLDNGMPINPPNWWLFLVAEDTRASEGLPSGDASWRVASASAPVWTPCRTTAAQAEPLLHESSIGMPSLTIDYDNAYVAAPGADAMRPTQLPESVVDASGATHTDAAEIEALFSPALAGLSPVPATRSAQTVEGLRLTLALTPDGRPQSLLNGQPVPDGLLYSVLTATALEGPWESLDAAVGKKGLAQEEGKGYTRLQLSDLSGKILPSLGDKTRFYQVRQSKTNEGE